MIGLTCRDSRHLVMALILVCGVVPASAFEVSGFWFPDPDRSLSQRPTGRATYDDAVESYHHARDSVVEYQRSLSVVDRFGQTLSGELRALFEQIPADRRSTFDLAITTVLDNYSQAVATNQDLMRRLMQVAQELRSLQAQIARVDGGQLRLRGDIELLHRSEEALLAEQRRIEAALPDVSACEELARTLALQVDRELSDRRSAFWTEVGRHFKDRALGEPVDYALPLVPLTAQTQRRTTVRDERRTTSPVVAAASAMVAPAVVIASRGAAFPMAATASRPPLPAAGSEDQLREKLDSLRAIQQENSRLSAKAQASLIESEQARYQLKLHIEAEQAIDRKRTVVSDAVDRMRTKVGLMAWELEQKSAHASGLFAKAFQDSVEISRWELLSLYWSRALKDQTAANTLYAYTHLTSEVTSVIGQAPEVGLHSGDPRVAEAYQAILAAPGKIGPQTVRDLAGEKSINRQMVEHLMDPDSRFFFGPVPTK